MFGAIARDDAIHAGGIARVLRAIHDLLVPITDILFAVSDLIPITDLLFIICAHLSFARHRESLGRVTRKEQRDKTSQPSNCSVKLNATCSFGEFSGSLYYNCED